MHLNNSKNNKSLTSNYVEKIVSSLKTSNISNVLDALNYLELTKTNIKRNKDEIRKR